LPGGEAFFHDTKFLNDGTQESLRTPDFLANGYQLVNFNYDKIIGDVYESSVEYIAQHSWKKASPPGKAIDFSKESYNFDDQKYVILPSTDYQMVSAEHHKKAMIRFAYHLSATLNLSAELATYQLVLDPQKHLKNSPEDKPDTWHLDFTEISLIFGGHHTGTGKPVNQASHKDHEGKGLLSSCKDLEGRFYPGSFIIPLESSRTIYINGQSNLVTVVKGQYLFFSGNVVHGGITYDHSDDWFTSIHGHLDSFHWERHKGVVKLVDLTGSNPVELTAALGTFGNVKKKMKSLHEDMKFLVNHFWEQKMDEQTKDANFLKMMEEYKALMTKVDKNK